MTEFRNATGNRWAIRKDRVAKRWDVFVDGNKLVSFDTWEECRAMVSYQVRVRPRVEKTHNANFVKALDVAFLVIGVITSTLVILTGWWVLLPVPLCFILISVRGFILQDYYHVTSRPRYR